MYESAEKMIEQYNMLETCEHIVLGLSGGADSVCLLLILKEYISIKKLGITLHAIHVNHGIRGEEAERDEAFSRELCRRLEVDFVCEHVDIPSMAKNLKQTEEEAGRNARYAIFERAAKTFAHARIAVAHHMNDQAETVLMNLLRGSSLKGMCGILPVRGQIIRPLLGVSRKDIEHYLADVGQEYVMDQTNTNLEYTRNRIREEVLPYLSEHVNPQAVKRVAELAESMQEVQNYLSHQIQEAFKKYVVENPEEQFAEREALLNKNLFLEQDSVIVKGVIRKALGKLAGAEKDIYKNHVEEVYGLFERQVHKSISLPYKLSARQCYDGIWIGHAGEEDCPRKRMIESEWEIEIQGILEGLEPGVPVRIPVEHMIYMGKDGMVYISHVVLEMQDNVDFSLNNDYTKVFDYDRMKGNLIFRFRRDGDRMMVTADGQTRKLKKELIDRKIPREIRSQILLLASDSEVYWAVGVRRSEDCLIDSASKSILRVTLE